MKRFLFDRKFAKMVILIAAPLMLQQLISVSVNLVDNLMVGSLGDAALGAVASANKYYMIASFSIEGLTAAAGVFIAQFFGAKDQKHMQQAFATMLIVGFIIITGFSLLAMFSPETIMNYFTHDANIIGLAKQYFAIAVFSYFPIAITTSFYYAARAIGETKIPLYISSLAVVINAVLNYIFIFGKFGFAAMGIEGAALATVCARVIELLLVLYALRINSFMFKFPIHHLFQIEKQIVTHILSKAAPLTLNELMFSFGLATLYKFQSTRGSMVMSGLSISSTVADLFFTLFIGLSVASNVFISTHLGANELEKAKENAYKLIGFSMVVSLIFSCMMYATTYMIPYLYRHVSAESLAVARTVLTVQACVLWIYTINAQNYFILRAGGDMRNTLLMDSGFMWVINIPIVACVTYFTNVGYIAIYIVGQLVDLLKLGISYRLVRKENWVKNLTQI